jgi:hypothetical protein
VKQSGDRKRQEAVEGDCGGGGDGGGGKIAYEEETRNKKHETRTTSTKQLQTAENIGEGECVTHVP